MIKCAIVKSVAGVENGTIKYHKETEEKVFASVKSLNIYKDELIARHELPIKTEISEIFFDRAELESAVLPVAEKLDPTVTDEIIKQVIHAFELGCLVKRVK